MGYLIISRRLNERITIGDDIEIMVAGIEKSTGKIDIAIKAPREKYLVLRKETHMEEEKSGPTTRDKSRSRYKRD